jgi:hypothetical protein
MRTIVRLQHTVRPAAAADRHTTLRTLHLHQAARWTSHQQSIAQHWTGTHPSQAAVGPDRLLAASATPAAMLAGGLPSFPVRVLGRPGATQRSAPPAPPVSESVIVAHGAGRYWDGQPSSMGSLPIPVPTVELLTDQVLRTVDQRLVAARERLSHR